MEENLFNLDGKKTLSFKETIAAFVHYFSLLDSNGLASILEDDVLYDEQSKQDWITLFEKQFESFRKKFYSERAFERQ